jgi:hypothetical protein
LKKLLRAVFIFVVVLWFLVSILRTFYNIARLFPEIKEWMFLSEDQKRIKMFGDNYSFVQFIKENLEQGSSVAIYTPDSTISRQLHLLSTYYLYPGKILFLHNLNNLEKTINNKITNNVAIYYSVNAESALNDVYKLID